MVVGGGGWWCVLVGWLVGWLCSWYGCFRDALVVNTSAWENIFDGQACDSAVSSDRLRRADVVMKVRLFRRSQSRVPMECTSTAVSFNKKYVSFPNAVFFVV